MASRQSSEKPKTKRQIQADSTRQSFIDYGSRLIQEKSFTDVSIEEIADACGVSKGLFYHYFSSKQEFLGAICAEPFENLNRKFRSNDDTPIVELVVWYADTWITMMYRNHLKTSADWVAASADVEFRDSYRKATGSKENYAYDCIASVDDRIKHAIDKGELAPDTDSWNISRVVVGLLLGTLVTRCLSIGDSSEDEWRALNEKEIKRLLEPCLTGKAV